MGVLRSLGSHSHLLLRIACVLLGLWVLWPMVQSARLGDDFVFSAMMEDDFGRPRHPLDLFNFAAGTPEDAAAMRENGYPWFLPDDFKIRMMRPLPAALIWFDHHVFGEDFALHHVHSLLWWVVLVLAAVQLYRRHFTPGVATFALLLFATDPSHVVPAGWLANRAGVMAVAFGLWGLLCHLRWREQGDRRARWLSPLLFAIALLCGEWTFPLLAYLAAYELMRHESLLQRALALVPVGALALTFLVLRSTLGFGASGSGGYVDPQGQPLTFLAQMWQRFAIFMADMVLDVPSEWWERGSPWRDRFLSSGLFTPEQWQQMPVWTTWHIALGVLAVAVLAVALRAAWPSGTDGERATLRWLLLGACLALLPVAGSFPSRRLVMVSMIGMAPVFAYIARALVWKVRSLAIERRAVSYAGAWLALSLLIWVQILSVTPMDSVRRAYQNRALEYWAKHAGLDAEKVAGQTVVLLSSGDFTTSVYFPYLWRERGVHPRPRSTYTLSIAPHAHFLRRVSETELELEALGGTFMQSDPERNFRPPDKPLWLGQQVAMRELTAEVVRMHQGFPRAVRFRFARSLDSEDYVFLSAQPGGILPFELPAIGEQKVLPRSSIPSFLGSARHHYERDMKPFPTFLYYDPVPNFVEFRPL